MKTLFVALFLGVLSVAAALAPLRGVGLETAIPDEYLIVLKNGFSIEMRDSHISELSAAHPTTTIMHSWSIGKFIAFAAVMDKGALARELEHEDVQYIEANQVVSVSADDTITQDGATWGIDRVSQRDLPLNGKYEYFESGGKDVDCYVIDTGILLSHQEFAGGRANFGANFISGETNEDCNGHGTHVAGTIAGKVYGLAKNAHVWSVKVLNCGGSGSYAGVISGIQWAADHRKHTGRRGVANMSLGGGASQTVDDAVNGAVETGLTMVVAAGNDNRDGCLYSPARAADAITVGATQSNDARSSFSNFGKCLDLFAPGTSITAAWYTSTTATAVLSGTSMASPHVAGAVACLLGHVAALDPKATLTPAEIVAHLTKVATPNKVTTPGAASPNLLLYSEHTNA